MAVGLVKPAIVLPPWFVDLEPDHRIEAALAHEWEHIRNGDLGLLALSRLLLPLLFAHPLYAWLRGRIRADQEALADAAAASSEGRIAYAEALVCWSRAGIGRTSSGYAPSLGLWGRSSSLAGRVALLLDRDFRVEPSCPRPWRHAVRGVFVMILIGLGLASLSGSAGLPIAANGAGVESRVRPHVHRIAALTCPSGDVEASGTPRWDELCKPGGITVFTLELESKSADVYCR